MQTVIIATAKLIVVLGILTAIARVRHESPLDDPFFDTQNWTLSDAYKLIVPLALLSYLQSIIYHLLLDRISDYWLLWFCMTSGCLASIATYAIYYWVIKKPYEIGRAVLGLDKAKFLKSGVVNANIAVIVLLLVITDYKHPAISTNTASLDMNLMIAVTLGLVLTIFLGPVLEEMLFRGIAYTPVARRMGRWKSIGLLSLVVALSHSHYEVTPTFGLFFLELSLYYVYTRSKSLYGPIVWHITVNFLANRRSIALIMAPYLHSDILDKCYIYSLLLCLVIVNVFWLAEFLRKRRLQESRSTLQHGL